MATATTAAADPIDTPNLIAADLCERDTVFSFGTRVLDLIRRTVLHGSPDTDSLATTTDGPTYINFPSCSVTFSGGILTPEREYQPVLTITNLFNTRWADSPRWKAITNSNVRYLKLRKDGTFNIESAVESIIAAEADRFERNTAIQTGPTAYRKESTKERIQAALPTLSVVEADKYAYSRSGNFQLKELRGIFVDSYLPGRFRVDLGVIEDMTAAQLNGLLTWIKSEKLRLPMLPGAAGPPHREFTKTSHQSYEYTGSYAPYAPPPVAPDAILVDDDKGVITSTSSYSPTRTKGRPRAEAWARDIYSHHGSCPINCGFVGPIYRRPSTSALRCKKCWTAYDVHVAKVNTPVAPTSSTFKNLEDAIQAHAGCWAKQPNGQSSKGTHLYASNGRVLRIVEGKSQVECTEYATWHDYYTAQAARAS